MHTTDLPRRGPRWLPALGRLWPLLALLALILFPFGWLGERWPWLDGLLGWLFAGARAHAYGHALLFLLLGLAALAAFPALRQRPWRYVGLLLAAALAQEAFQLLYKQRPLQLDELRDLATDLVGGLAALAAVWARR